MARKKVQDQGEELKMDMSPMIDCVFLLLIFFIVVSTQSEVRTDPEVEPTIASASVPQTDSIARIVVNVYYSKESGGIVYTDEDVQPVATDDLEEYIGDMVEEISKTRDKKLITLHMRCDRNVEWKDIQVVKKAAAKKGVIKVNFASFQE